MLMLRMLTQLKSYTTERSGMHRDFEFVTRVTMSKEQVSCFHCHTETRGNYSRYLHQVLSQD